MTVFRREDWKYVISAILFAILATALVITFGIRKTSGHSMEPAYFDGDVVLVLQVKMFFPSNLNGTVVVYQSPTNETLRIAHRVVADNGTHIITKGDNNSGVDHYGWFSKEYVTHIVLFAFRL